MSTPLPRLNWLMEKVNMVTVGVVGLVMAAMALHVITDVLLRYFAGRPLDGTTEIVARYYMVTLVFLPLAYVQAHDRHIVAGLLGEAIPQRAAQILNALAALLMLVFAVLLAWRTGIEAVRATRSNEQIQTAFIFLSTWPARWIIPVASVLLAFQSLLMLAQSILSFLFWDRYNPRPVDNTARIAIRE